MALWAAEGSGKQHLGGASAPGLVGLVGRWTGHAGRLIWDGALEEASGV